MFGVLLGLGDKFVGVPTELTQRQRGGEPALVGEIVGRLA